MRAKILLGANVRVGYFAQDAEDLDPSSTALETCGSGTLLACLKVCPDRMNQPLRDLSAGERTKVALVRLLVSGANLLLLDEPTNHLEIEAPGGAGTSAAAISRSCDGGVARSQFSAGLGCPSARASLE
jgi:ATPase subunit of ABC transporter with duplicated ATPase domains